MGELLKASAKENERLADLASHAETPLASA
jgi:hypothetical protein